MVNVPLFLSDVGGSEILLILMFILVFFGSKSIPGIARTMGRTIRQIKDASQDVQNEIRKSTVDMKADLNINSIVSDAKQTIEGPFKEHASTLDQVMSDHIVDHRIQRPKTMVQPISQPIDQPIDQPQEEPAPEEQKGEV
jgi:sec-independent protein translocase protein TatA